MRLASSSDIDAPAIHVGSEKQPLALAAEKVRVPSFASPESFRLQDGGNRQLGDAIRNLANGGAGPSDPLLGFLQSSTTSALATSDRIAGALRDYLTPVTYPESALATAAEDDCPVDRRRIEDARLLR